MGRLAITRFRAPSSYAGMQSLGFWPSANLAIFRKLSLAVYRNESVEASYWSIRSGAPMVNPKKMS